jgi:hypothetical protein
MSESRRFEWCKFEFDWLGIEGVPIQNVFGKKVAVAKGGSKAASLERANSDGSNGVNLSAFGRKLMKLRPKNREMQC